MAESSSRDGNEGKNANYSFWNGWWNKYVVRYVPATILSVVCILSLTYHYASIQTHDSREPSTINECELNVAINNNYNETSLNLSLSGRDRFFDLKSEMTKLNCDVKNNDHKTHEDNTSLKGLLASKVTNLSVSDLVALGFIGLLYCYICSAPVLFIHVIRGAGFMNSQKTDGFCTRFFPWVIILGVLATSCAISFFGKPVYSSIFAAFIISLVQLIFLAIFASKNYLVMYNLKIFNLRAITDDLTDRRNTYTHLREHGNSQMNICLVLAMTCILWNVTELWQIPVIIILWIIPSTFAWQVANLIEYFCHVEKKPEVKSKDEC